MVKTCAFLVPVRFLLCKRQGRANAASPERRILVLTNMIKEQMKKTILLLLTFMSTFASVKAQNLIATLQQGDDVTAFYGVDALKQAYIVASDGAVITLSSGAFNAVDTIIKQITIIGNGFKEDKTELVGSSKACITYLNADNITLDGLYINGVVKSNYNNNMRFSHCYIWNLGGYSEHPGNNLTIEQCRINTLGFFNYEYRGLVKNSIIDFSHIPYGRSICFLNCLLGRANENVTYRNCILLAWEQPLKMQGEYYNNVFFGGVRHGMDLDEEEIVQAYVNVLSIDETTRYNLPELNTEGANNNVNTRLALFYDVFDYHDEENPFDATIITTVLGDDGTVVGPFGGDGFSTRPNIPRITERNIDFKTDEAGKLNVRLKVELGK